MDLKVSFLYKIYLTNIASAWLISLMSLHMVYKISRLFEFLATHFARVYKITFYSNIIVSFLINGNNKYTSIEIMFRGTQHTD
jgi:hypothetical protein